ncbi:FAD-dependent oxidoreductase [Streptomyces sp. NPDC006356]
MTDSAVIVGSGVIGLATAHRLAQDGLSVTVVGAAGPPAAPAPPPHTARGGPRK